MTRTSHEFDRVALSVLQGGIPTIKFMLQELDWHKENEEGLRKTVDKLVIEVRYWHQRSCEQLGKNKDEI